MTRRIRPASFTRFGVMFLAACALVPAQQPPTGWRRANDAPPQQAERLPDESAQADAFGQPLGQPGLRPPDGQMIPPPPMPPQLTLAPGKFITVRLNQGLSSDRNQPGDPFSATLTEPLVIDGVVVAQRGQTVFGRVAQAQRAKASQPSGLGLELTGITLVDGTQATVRTQLVGRHGGSTPTGEQVGTVAATTAVGAAIGAAADWGRGAAIGGVAGAAAGIVGVMLTRNHPTIVYPETALTFRIDSQLTISTVRAPLAFRFIDPYEYDRPQEPPQLQPRPGPGPRPIYGPGYGPAWGGYYPYRWGPGVSLVIGGGWYRGYYPRYRRWR